GGGPRRGPAPVAVPGAAGAGGWAGRQRRDEEARVETARLPLRRDPVREVRQRRQVGGEAGPGEQPPERLAPAQRLAQPGRLVRRRRASVPAKGEQHAGLLEQLPERGPV